MLVLLAFLCVESVSEWEMLGMGMPRICISILASSSYYSSTFSSLSSFSWGKFTSLPTRIQVSPILGSAAIKITSPKSLP